MIAKLRKEMIDRSLMMHLRTTVCLKDIGLFSAANKVYGDSYSGNHVAIFETDMKAPPQLSLVDHDQDAIIKAYRINLNKVKIADVDNFMRGNSYF